MVSRRKFLKQSAFASAASLAAIDVLSCGNVSQKTAGKKAGKIPILISTWDFGKAPHEAGWKVLTSPKGTALDACIEGVKIVEADATNHSVGLGGYPDRDGHVTLDSSVMDENGNCGGVMCMENILHACSVARLVMEKTPHVYLSGDGAYKFAIDNGFKKQNLLTDEAKLEWQKWLRQNNYTPAGTNHDTIGMLSIDRKGNLSGVCSTSGWAYKMHGRIGDSPVIGSGLFVDNEVGAAVGTGLGEYIIKICGSHLIVESMRNGKTPQEACELACNRIASKYKNYKDVQACFIALDKDGTIGAYSLHKGFQYSTTIDGETLVYDSEFLD